MWHAWETVITQIWMKLRVLKDKLGGVILLKTLIQKDVQVMIVDEMYRNLIFLMNEQGGYSLDLAELPTTRETKQLESLINFHQFFSGMQFRIN